MLADSPVVHIIDDDDAVRESLEALLVVSGFEVATYGSAEAYLARGTFVEGCIVLDINMSGIGGLDLLQALSRREWKIPVLVLSANREPREAERAIELGASAFLTKPVREAILVEAIRAAQVRR